MDTVPARITITRHHPNDVRQRQIVTSIDGAPLATLMYGESVTRELPAGRHRLKAHNTLFWKTCDMELAPGEHARFRVVNRSGAAKLPGCDAFLKSWKPVNMMKET